MRNYTLTARSVFNYLDAASRVGADGTTNTHGVQMVLDNSTRGPAFVNYWSAKAGPCLRFYPLLDKLAH